MLRARMIDADGRRTIICGLEPGNIERMNAGQPVFFDARQLGVDCNICIITGESPEAMARDLGAVGLDAKPEGTA